MTIKPASRRALPTQTFKDTHTIYANGETLRCRYIKPRTRTPTS